MRRILILAAIMTMIIGIPLHAVGTIQQSLSQLGTTNNWVLAINWTGDSVTGSVPATPAFSNPTIQGYRIFSAEVSPGPTAPTNNYSVTLTTYAGVDMLVGTGATLSNVSASALQIPTSAPPLNGTVTINITGNSVPSAQGKILVYFGPVTNVFGVTATGVALGANNIFTGTNTFQAPVLVKNLNSIRYADQFPGATADVQIANAIADGPASGVIVDARGQQGTQTWASNIFTAVTKPVTLLLGKYIVNVNVPQTPNSFVRILGEGLDATALNFGFASGCMFSTVNGSKEFELANLTVDGSFVTRTSGFVVCAASNAGRVHDIKAIQPYGIVLLQGASGFGAQGWVLDRIVFTGPSTSVHQGSQFSFGGGDGSSISDTYITNITELGGYASLQDAPQVLLDTGIDTMKFINFDVGYSSNIPATSQPVIKIQNTGATFAPRWVRFLHASPESGQVGGVSTADCFNASDGNHILIQNSYFVHCGGRGLTISGGSNWTVENTVIGTNGTGGIYFTGTAFDLSVSGSTFAANSMATTNTTDDIQVASGTLRFSLTKNHFNKDIPALNVAQQSRYGINLLASTTTSDFYIEDNDYTTTAFGTGYFRDVTVGLNKIIQTNEGGTFILSGNVSADLWELVSGGTKFNWRFGCQQNLNNACEITPSTAIGGTTFTNPGFSVSTSTGAANSATVTANGTLTMTNVLQPTTAAGVDVGTAALPFGNLWLGTAATNNFKFQPAATSAARIISLPDPGVNVNMPYSVSALTFDAIYGTYRVTADQTITAGASLTAIPGLTWTFPANTALNVKFSCDLLYSQATAAASDSFGFQDVTVAPTNAESYARADTSTTAFTAGNTDAAGVTTAVTVVTYTPSAATTVFGAHIDGLIEQPSNASTSVFNIMAQFTTNNGTIKRGSSCQVF